MSDTKIYTDMPPPFRSGGGGTKARWDFASLPPGASFNVDMMADGAKLRAAANYYRHRHPDFRFVSKAVKGDDGKFRCRLWRVDGLTPEQTAETETAAQLPLVEDKT